MRSFRTSVPSFLAPMLLALTACTPASEPTSTASVESDPSMREVTLRSEVFTLESQFESMNGPSQSYPVTLEGIEGEPLVWLHGITNRAVSPNDEALLSDEFLCHSNLALPLENQDSRSRAAFASTASSDPRVFTLIQGRNDLNLPAGFAYPVSGEAKLYFDTMIINKNWSDLPLDVRVDTTLRYSLPSERVAMPQALFKRRIFTYLRVDTEAETDQHGGAHADHMSAMEGGETASAPKASWIVGRDQMGREFTFHWVVEPGEHEYRSSSTRQLDLPFDTTLHYATAHLHPYGKSIRLIDLETNETVIDLSARQYDDKIGIAEMEEYSSASGIELFADHSYQLVTEYENTTDHPIDAMAIVYLFFHDKSFALGSEG